jgi:TRAP-type C4-dicarboxylate transport system substrate-binding protein
MTKEALMNRMTRRTFLRTASAGAVFTATGSFGKIAFAAVPTYTGVTYLTPGYTDIHPPVMGFVEQLKKAAGDSMKIDFFDSGTLVKTDEQVQALRAGTIQFMLHTSSYVTRTYPILGVTGLPSLCLHLYDHGERMNVETPLWKLINDVLAKDNTFMLTSGGGNYEPEYIWSGNNKVTSLAELKGRRVRIVSYEAEEALKPFGVAGARIPSSELYLAVQRGTVDAVVANVSTVTGRKVHEQVKYCYKLPVTAFCMSFFFLKSTWDKLPDKAKAAFWEAGKWYDTNGAPAVNKNVYPQSIWPMVTKAGVKAVTPTAEELKLFEERSQPVWAWWKKQVGEEIGQKAINLATGKA